MTRPGTGAAPAANPEPGSPAALQKAIADARGHVFLLFLDAAHVSSAASRQIGAPLARLIDRLLTSDDLIGVMTADMSASQVTFGHRADVLRDGLLSNPSWGRRFERTKFDKEETQYDLCYPMLASERRRGRMISKLAQELIERRRERMTLDAFSDIISTVSATTRARTTLLVVTEGWLL